MKTRIEVAAMKLAIVGLALAALVGTARAGQVVPNGLTTSNGLMTPNGLCPLNGPCASAAEPSFVGI